MRHPAATIYYTANGSTPTASSSLYTSPIKVTATETLQAIAVLADSGTSPVATATYVINVPQTPTAATTPVRSNATLHANAQTGTQTTTVALPNTVQAAGIDRLGVNIGGLGGYGSQQIFKSLNYVNGGYFPGAYAATTYSCSAGGNNTTNTWYNNITNTSGYPANFWVGATFDAINAATGTSYGTGTITASTSNTGDTGITFTLSPSISSACNPSQNDVMIVRLTKQNTLISPYQELNQHICNNATWNTSDTSPASSNTQQSLQMPSGCGLTFYIDATTTNRTNSDSNLASQQVASLNLNGSYNATFKAKCLSAGCSVNFSLGRLGGTTFLGNTVVNPASNGTSGAGWTTYNYPFTASENGTQSQTVGYSFTCSGTCLLQDADVVEGSTLAGNTTAFRDAVVYELQKLHPGSIRYMDGSQWCSDVADEIAATGNRRWCGASNYSPGVTQPIGYSDVLALGKLLGSDVLISVGALNQPSDWATLITWLNTSGWTSTYSSMGRTIYLEDGNEAWNSGVGGTLYFGNGLVYGYTLGRNMAAAKAAPGYNSTVIKLVGDSWAAGSQGYGPFGWVHNVMAAAQVTPNGLPDFVDDAPYMLNYLGNFDTAGSSVATTGAPFLDEWAENANIDSVTSPPIYSQSMYLNQQYMKSNYGINTLVYELNFSTLAGIPATQLQLDQIGASVGNALATTQHALLMQRDSQVTGPIHIFTLAEPYTGYSCNGCGGGTLMPLWGINHLMGTGPGQAPGTVTGDRPLAIAMQVVNNAIGSNSNLMSLTQSGTPTFSYPGGQVRDSSNSITSNSAVPYVNCFSYSDGASAWTVICFNNNLTTSEPVTLTGAGAPTGSVSQTIFPGPSNVITDHNENTFMGSSSIAPVVTLPSPTNTSGTTYTIPPASMMTLTYTLAGNVGGTPTLAAPSFAPGTGNYSGTQNVTITLPAGSTGCVGINSTPTAPTAGTCGAGGSTYTGQVTVNSTATVNVIATKAGSNNSSVASATYTIAQPSAATPTMSPAAGTYTTAQAVSISDATPGSTIYYTTNGSTPTTSSNVYGGAINVSTTQTLQAIAVAPGYTNSAVASATYNINPALPAPTFSPAAGTYIGSQSVTLNDATAGTILYYTTDGSTPTTSSNVYGGAITVAATETLQAIAVKSGFTTSPVASSAYVINAANAGGTSYINLGAGQFASSSFFLNGAFVANGALQITDGNVYENRSAWFNTKVPVGSFTTDFTFQQLNARADGMTFVLQGLSPTALGQAGPGLGYSGISNSVAIKFDLWDNSGEGVNSTGLYTGGVAPTVPSTDLTPSGINLHSGNLVRAHLVYDGTNLSLTLTDTITGASFVKIYPIDIPGTIGSSTAYVGFTGSTGTYAATQNITTWSYVAGGNGVTPTAATPSFSPAGGTYTTAQSVTITDATPGTTIYYTTNGTTPTTSSNVYGGAINVSTSQTVQAIAVASGFTNSAVGSAAYTINTVLPAPTFSPAGGTYTTAQSVTITDATPGTTLYYTTNGTTPTTSSNVYSGAINVPASQTIQAIAVKSGSTNSPTGAAAYTINLVLPAPTFSPAGGTYSSAQSVSISDSTAGTSIYYTTNGATPTTNSNVYSGAINVSASQTIQAIAVAAGFTNSAVASAAYTINSTLPAPTFSPAAGTYSTAQSVSINDATVGTTIYYTLNGTTPTTSSAVYAGPINVAASQTVQAIAAKAGSNNSAIGSATYVISPVNNGGGGTTYINLGAGQFASSSFFLNGAFVANGALQITDGNVYENRSAWFNTKVPVGSFTTDFTFQQLNARADGMTFVLQGLSPTALGQAGPGLGYSGISNSVAIKFDLWDNSGEGVNSTGLYTGGVAPTVPSTDLTPSGINLHSGNLVRAHLVYDGTNLSLTLTDTITGASFVQIYPIDIPGTIGSSTAYVGFTGSTGTYAATQNITTWSYVAGGGGVTPTAATPSFSPAGGTYTTAQSVTITDATPGTTIYYTTNGTTPTTSSNVYGGAINVSASQTVQAIAVASGFTNSAVGSAAYTINTVLPAPTFSPAGGTYTTAQSVTITDATPGTTIYYTTNGTTPTASSNVYSGAINVSASQTVQAIAVASGFTNSAVGSAAYTINTVLPAPTFSPAGGTYTTNQSVTITDATPGTTIYYTTNGSLPTTGSTVYGGAITVSSSQTIQAIAVKAGSTTSPVSSAAYSITQVLPAPSFSPAGGSYTGAQTVSLGDTVSGTTIYYTTNGTTPTTSSSVYSGPINVGTSQTIQAIAVEAGYTNSPVASASFTINPVNSGGGTTYVNFASGQFATSSFYLNGGSGITSNGALQLTDGNVNEVRSAWFKNKVPVGSFTNDFTFQMINASADGMTFTFQNAGTGALGSAGPGLGYQNIGSSVAIKFDMFNNSGEGANSTGVYSGGTAPTVPSTDLSSTGIDLHSSNTIHAHMVYDGANLSLTLTDTVTGTSFTKVFAIDIPGAVGGSTAYVGFTGSTGTYTVNENILAWTYSSQGGGPAPTAATPGFAPAGGTYTGAQSVTLSDTTAGTTIYYTTNGSIPTAASSIYNGPITVAASQTLQAIAVAAGYTNSPVATAAYTINAANNGSTTYINLSTGQFTSSLFNLDGGASVTSAGALQITDGNVSQVRSAWFKNKVPIGNFVTDFTFLLSSARADGMTFTIQNQSPTALGSSGPGLGYQGISNSVAVKFDLWDNSGEGINSTGVFSGGVAPTVPSVDLASTGIDLHGGDLLRAHMVYDGSNLTMTLTDTVTGAAFVKVFPIDIQGAVGASAAYVGFTGSTGTYTANQNILTWSYTTTP